MKIIETRLLTKYSIQAPTELPRAQSAKWFAALGLAIQVEEMKEGSRRS